MCGKTVRDSRQLRGEHGHSGRVRTKVGMEVLDPIPLAPAAQDDRFGDVEEMAEQAPVRMPPHDCGGAERSKQGDGPEEEQREDAANDLAEEIAEEVACLFE